MLAQVASAVPHVVGAFAGIIAHRVEAQTVLGAYAPFVAPHFLDKAEEQEEGRLLQPTREMRPGPGRILDKESELLDGPYHLLVSPFDASSGTLASRPSTCRNSVRARP